MFLLCFIVYNRMKNLIEISKTIDEFLHIFFYDIFYVLFDVCKEKSYYLF